MSDINPMNLACFPLQKSDLDLVLGLAHTTRVGTQVADLVCLVSVSLVSTRTPHHPILTGAALKGAALLPWIA